MDDATPPEPSSSESTAPEPASRGTVLLTGATGFIGRHLYPALDAAGYGVRCGSRDPDGARRQLPDRQWVEIDLSKPHTLAPALDGVDRAVYLVHSMGGSEDGGTPYDEKEAAAATDFAAAAGRAGLDKVVYLGGVAPQGEPSRHLASRLRVGEILRDGPVPTHELRAAMIIGTGGSSWRIVRDLAKRLPAMVLPGWLKNRSAPVFIDDVALALLGALDLEGTGWLDVPGPELLSHRELLDRVAEAFGFEPVMIDVPFVTPRLSSYWIGLVTGASLPLAQELVEGLTSDLVPSGPSVWDHLDHRHATPLDQAIAAAIADEEREDPSSPDPWKDAPTTRRRRALEERTREGSDGDS